MVARLLNVLGVYLGAPEDLLAASDENPAGYWEHLRFIELNDEILDEMGGAWDIPPPSGACLSGEAFGRLRLKAKSLADSFPEGRQWGWKDPCNSLTAPFWQEVLPGLRVVVCLRHPLEVALSLRRRAKLSKRLSLALWQTYNERILELTDPAQRLVTHFDKLFSDPTTELRRMSEFLSLPVSDDVVAEARLTINAEHRHGRLEADALVAADVSTEIAELYRRMSAEAGMPDDGVGLRTPEIHVSALTSGWRSDRAEGSSWADAVLAATPARAATQLGHIDEPASETTETPHDVYYRELTARIQSVVCERLPARSTVMITSKGDDQLLALEDRRGWHFPQSPDGAYSGYHPRNDTVAIALLEAARSAGGDFFLLPSTSLWWLDEYPGLRRHLETRFPHPITDESCLIFDVRRPDPKAWPVVIDELLSLLRVTLARHPAVLDWDTGLRLAEVFPGHRVFSPLTTDGQLAYLDETIDVVALAEDETSVTEANRVAAGAVITVRREASTPTTGDAARCQEISVAWKVQPQALPSVSIIIPCFNHASHTERCLKSLRETLPAFDAEIIAVDDGSSDETSDRLAVAAEQDARLKVLRNQRNCGFLRSCNRAAGEATGDVLLFLNNDTIALPGWLPPLLLTIVEQADAGAVGGRLLYPDGRLQEAGGVIFDDGSAAKFGYGETDPDNRLFTVFREVDYCSGALLATPRQVFLDVGGFDPRYDPAYYEDVDYCFTLRERGLRVYYQPDSTVIHYEGVTAGTDLTKGVKRHQVTNQVTFAEKWAQQLPRQASRPELLDLGALRSLAARSRVASSVVE